MIALFQPTGAPARAGPADRLRAAFPQLSPENQAYVLGQAEGLRTAQSLAGQREAAPGPGAVRAGCLFAEGGTRRLR